MRVSEYPRQSKLLADDLLLVETAAGTKTITVGGLNKSLSIIRKNLEIRSSQWTTYSAGDDVERRLIEHGYSYRSSLSIDGVASDMIPFVTLDFNEISEVGVTVANLFNTYDGGIYIYADAIASGSIHVLSIECRSTM